jgi:hypothetical protein
MKLRFAHMEKEETVFWKGEYVIDTDKFPELKDIKDDAELMKWLWNNDKKVGVNGDYEDPDAERRGLAAYEVVPLDKNNKEQARLYDYVIDSSVIWEKNIDNDAYFEVSWYMDEAQETFEEMNARIDRELKEHAESGHYEI